jgi:hypothetical protein
MHRYYFKLIDNEGCIKLVKYIISSNSVRAYKVIKTQFNHLVPKLCTRKLVIRNQIKA